MSHFSKDGLASDPEGLARLHEILHGTRTAATAAAAVPKLAERFGATALDRPSGGARTRRPRKADLTTGHLMP